MISLKLVRESPQSVKEALARRGQNAQRLDELLRLDEEWRGQKKQADDLRSKRNAMSLQIAEAKKTKQNTDETIAQTQKISSSIKELDGKVGALESQMDGILLYLPNIPDASVPVGKDETANVEVRKWGEPKKKNMDVMAHYELVGKLGIDFERGAKIAGSRFTILSREIARLERALVYYMLENAIGRGYAEYSMPYLANEKTVRGSGQLPKFAEELYTIEKDGLYLIPTAEVPLANLYAGEILAEEHLPIKVCSYTPCFRREAGNYQKDIKGMLRQHQFHKIELFKFTAPERSFEELEGLVNDAEAVLRGLDLPYRVIELCTGDIGFASAKTYDIEVWIPSQNKYREISSCSNCTDFQARRANIRYWKGGKPEFLHTLNGSGMAVGRTMIAVLENYQDAGGIAIPKPLQDFMGAERIEFRA
jgi:seryl-tRNA synthetase